MPTTRRPSPAEQRAAREARRLQAAELFAQGHTPKPRSPASWASPVRPSAAGTAALRKAAWRRCAAVGRPAPTPILQPHLRPATDSLSGQVT